MLVIEMKRGDGVEIGDGVKVRILRVRKNGKIKIGIDAPPEVRIVRDDAKVREPKVQVQ